uniref:hypothetical protein n=1 Tax=Siphonobacter sp. TaxID=1869184 RepID=UPI003B3A817D
DQPEYLYYLHNFEDEVLSVQIFCTQDNGSTQQFNAYGIDAKTYGVYGIPIGPTQIALPESTSKYEVAIVNQRNQRMTHVRTYYIDRTPYEKKAFITFQNSFGVYDTISLLGETITKATYESEVSPLLSAPHNRPQSFMSSRIEKLATTYRSGHYPPGWMPYFSELLRSKKAAILEDGLYHYCNVSSTEAELVNTAQPGYSLEFTVTSEDSSPYFSL